LKDSLQFSYNYFITICNSKFCEEENRTAEHTKLQENLKFKLKSWKIWHNFLLRWKPVCDLITTLWSPSTYYLFIRRAI